MTAKESYEHLKWEWIKSQHPTAWKNDPETFERGFRETCRFPRISGAPSLERAIVDYITYAGFQASKITTSGRFVKGKITFTDVIGRTRVIGNDKWIPGGSTKGVADIIATVYGLKIDIEVKYSKGDRQRETQKRYEEAVTKAGGFYIIVRSFEDFYNKWNDLMDHPKIQLLKEM